MRVRISSRRAAESASHVNRDEMRGKGEVAAAARAAMDARRVLLVDNCNLSAAIRAA